MIDSNMVILGKQRTSQAAAKKIFSESGNWRRRVYAFVDGKGFDGATDQEIQDFFKKSGDTIRPTRISLVRDGYLSDSGRTRKNASGNECIVWVSDQQEGKLF